MTLNEMTIALNATRNFGTDYAGVYGISDSEAERIAERCSTAADFEIIWNNSDWWTDANCF
jgi:hypothetical protein